jgi:2-methylcitrate dehydratase
MPCRIEIELNDGKKLSIDKHDYEGFNTHPMPWGSVVAKFNSLASPYASTAQRAAIVNAVEKLESLKVNDLIGVLNVPFAKASHAEPKKSDKQHEKELALAV